MTRSERVLGFVVASALVAISPTSARAQPEPQSTRGATAEGDPLVPFEEGRTFVKSGRYAEALQKFEASVAIKETSGAVLNIGDCQEKLGRYASAAKAFRRAQRLAEQGGVADRAKVAADRAAALRTAVSTLTVRLARKVNGAEVSVDGNKVEPETAIEIDGGQRHVRVVAPCHRAEETDVAVGVRGDTKQVSVELVPAPDAPGCPGAPPPPASAPIGAGKPEHRSPPPARDTGGTRRVIAYGAGGVGLVAVAIGVGTGIAASSNKSDLEAACSSYPRGCPAERRGELDRLSSDADTSAAISTAGFVTGALLLGGAAVLYLTALPKRTTALRPAVAPGFAGAAASVAF